MSELRRCSPEIEHELHDKEGRIRELEAALRAVLPMAKGYAHEHRVGANQDICDDAIRILAATAQEETERAEARIRELEAVYKHARGLCGGQDWNKGAHAKAHRKALVEAVNPVESLPNLDAGKHPGIAATPPPDSEPTEEEGGESCSWCGELREDVTWCGCDTPPQRRDALDDDTILRLLREHKVEGQTFKRWKDGIDIDVPTLNIERFANAIYRQALSAGVPEAGVSRHAVIGALRALRQKDLQVAIPLLERALAQSEQGRMPEVTQAMVDEINRKEGWSGFTLEDLQDIRDAMLAAIPQTQDGESDE